MCADSFPWHVDLSTDFLTGFARCKQTVQELLASPPLPQIVRLVDDVSDTVIGTPGFAFETAAKPDFSFCVN